MIDTASQSDTKIDSRGLHVPVGGSSLFSFDSVWGPLRRSSVAARKEWSVSVVCSVFDSVKYLPPPWSAGGGRGGGWWEVNSTTAAAVVA